MGVSKNMIVRVGADFSRMFGEFGKANKRVANEFSSMSKAAGNVKFGKGLRKSAVSAVDQLRQVREEITSLESYRQTLDLKLESVFRDPKQGEKSEAFRALHKGIDMLDTKLERLKGKEAILQVKAEIEPVESALDEVDKLYTKLEQLKGQEAVLQVEAETEPAESNLDRIKDKFSGLGGVFSGLGKKIAGLPLKGLKFGLKGITSSVKAVASGFGKMFGGLKRIGGMYLGLGLVTSVIGRLRSVVSSYISQNSALQAQVNGLQTAMGNALAPAINIVTNALSAMMPYILGVSNAIGQLIQKLFGKGWTTAAAGANAAAAATGSAAKAQEEYNNQLAGFDEITKLDSQSGSSSGGGGGGGSSSTSNIEAKTPEWLTGLTEQIKKAIDADDWTNVGHYVGEKLNGAIASAQNWLDSKDWNGLGENVAQGVNGSIQSGLESDVSIGSLIATTLNAGIRTSDGFLSNLDWESLSRLLRKNISEFFSKFDWASAFHATGALTGGISKAVATTIDDIIAGFKDYFSFYAKKIDEAGGNVGEGIWNGIKEKFTNCWNKVKEKIIDPFIDGFCQAFGINSPATNPDLLSAAGFVGEGILNGIKAPFEKVKTWVDEHIIQPIKNALDFKGDIAEFSVGVKDKATEWWNNIKSFFGKKSGNGENEAGKFGTNVSDQRESWWEKLTSLWNSKSKNGNAVAGKFGTSLTDNKTGWWNTLVNGWQTVSQNGSKEPGQFSTDVKNTSSRWWTNTKQYYREASGNGTNIAGDFSTELKNTSDKWWRDTVSWYDIQSKEGLHVTAGVALKKDGWTSLSSFIGSFTKTINASISWTSATGIVATAAKALFGISSLPSIRFFARGGIVDRASLFGNSVIGEQGQEAIVPLERNTQWADIVANQIAGILANSNNDRPIQITIPLVLDGRVIGQTAISYINGQAVATGVNPLTAYL